MEEGDAGHVGGLRFRPVPGLPMLGSSLLLHGLLLVLLAVASCEMEAWLRDEQLDWSRYKEEPLRLHLAEPLFFHASTPPQPAPAKVRRVEQAVAAEEPASASASAAAAPPEPPRPAALRRLELPTPREPAKEAPVILQPEYHPQMKPPVVVPPMAFWARQGVDLPKPPPRKTIVIPGRTEEKTAPPKLAAPPVPDVPNTERMAADINVSLPAALNDTPRPLPMPNSSTSPVRLRDATESQAASFDRSTGQAANVLAMANERRDVKDVQIPRGLQNIPKTGPQNGTADAVPGDNTPPARTTAAANSSTTGNGSAASAASAANANSTGSSKAPTAGAGQDSGPKPASPGAPAGAAGKVSATASATASAASTTASASTTPSPSTTATAPPGPSQAAPAAGGPARAGVEMASAAAHDATANAAPRPGTRPEATRIQHPSNGSFDVVIMQSGTRDDLPDLGGLLTGTPVYTVYLHVGDQREWLLEYCVPASTTARNNPYEIQVQDASPLTPPYPIATAIPTGFAALPVSKQIVLHGTLTASGSLRNIKSPDANNALANQILALLSEWQFRPVLRNKTPIEVEIVLVIPPRG